MSTHNMFYGEILKIIPKLSPNTHLISSTEYKMQCAPSEDSDQSVHPVCSVSTVPRSLAIIRGPREDRSDCLYMQADDAHLPVNVTVPPLLQNLIITGFI